jgi:FeS assembly SUF system protein
MNRVMVEFNQAAAASVDDAPLPGDAPLYDKVVAVLKGIYDPELPVNIYDLGLIYTIDIENNDVSVMMTLTTPNCPVAGSMPAKVECAIRELDEVNEAHVQLTWDPPWSQDCLSDEVKLTLGLL